MLNANDLKNIGTSLEEKMQKNSERKGEELANRIISSTANGRGLWIFILYPAFLTITITISSIINILFGVSLFISLIISAISSYFWYKANFTILHPFWSSILTITAIFIEIPYLIKN